MCTAIIGILIGKVLASFLMMIGLSFLFAWLIVTVIGIYIQFHQIMSYPCREVNNSIAFWILIGAMIPVLQIAIQ